MFNPVDKNPSMEIYVCPTGTYRFHDWSTGIKGDEVDLVCRLVERATGQRLNYVETCSRISEEYCRFLSNNERYITEELEVQSSYKLKSWGERKWNTLDQHHWTQFWIGSSALEYFEVRPLSGFVMSRDEEEVVREGNYIYGYFRKDGSLYKIYQPKNLKRKFMKVADYIQGTDQLTYTSKVLLIQSSLKDIMTVFGFDLGLEFMAPDSENSILRESTVSVLKKKYPYIFTLFDNDKAGRDATKLYEEKYGLPGIPFYVKKDIAEATKEYSRPKIKPIFERELNKLMT